MNINQIIAYSIGRRKKAIAQVILLVGSGKFTINKINANSYLQNNLNYLQRIAPAKANILSLHAGDQEREAVA